MTSRRPVRWRAAGSHISMLAPMPLSSSSGGPSPVTATRTVAGPARTVEYTGGQAVHAAPSPSRDTRGTIRSSSGPRAPRAFGRARVPGRRHSRSPVGACATMDDADRHSTTHREDTPMDVPEAYRAARDQLLALRGRHEAAVAEFSWPELGERFNWAVDWFDAIARGNDRPALVLVAADGTTTRRSFDEMTRRSDQLAGWLAGRGVRRGEPVLLMLGNQVEQWESMLARSEEHTSELQSRQYLVCRLLLE